MNRCSPASSIVSTACVWVLAALVDEGVASIEDTDRGAKIGLRWSHGPV